MNKSADAFRTISEVADELDLPQHVLRFWESKFAQLKPLKRGGGRRYYRPDDVALLRGIRSLLYGEGYTIRGVQKVLREQGARRVMDRIREDGAAAGDAAVNAPCVSDDMPIHFPAPARSGARNAALLAARAGRNPARRPDLDFDEDDDEDEEVAALRARLEAALDQFAAARDLLRGD